MLAMRPWVEVYLLILFNVLLISIASPSLPRSPSSTDRSNPTPPVDVDSTALPFPATALEDDPALPSLNSSDNLQARTPKIPGSPGPPGPKASYNGGPWTPRAYTCVQPDYNGQCNLFEFKGPDWKTTSQSFQTWRTGNEPDKQLKNHDWDVGCFGPDPGLICGLTTLNCAEGDKTCRLYGIESPGLRDVPEPFKSQTATMTCYMKGSKNWENMKKQS